MYSLIVSGAFKAWEGATFQFDKSRFLEYTSAAIKEQLRSLSNEAIECLQSWPCVLIQEGRNEEIVHIARITELSSLDGEIQVTVNLCPSDAPIFNHHLDRIREKLDIREFEFGRTHWAVKERDLFSILREAEHQCDVSSVGHFKEKPLPAAPTRASLMSARDVIAKWSHTEIDGLLLATGVVGLSADRKSGRSCDDRAHMIVKFAIENPAAVTADNYLFSTYLVRKTSVDKEVVSPAAHFARPLNHRGKLMPTCFVIQPFDSGKFDKRFQDTYKPAIEAAGLEAYRVDQDPGVLIPIDSIEKGIRQAAVCLADITADNPNVWYELGFAYAAGKPVVMVCSEERTGKKYPFDIQHRSIIRYLAEASSDFDNLRASITEKIETIVQQDVLLEKIPEESPVNPVHGLSYPEVLVLAVIANNVDLPNQGTAVNFAKRDAKREGVTNMGFNLAIRSLLQKKFIEEQVLLVDVMDDETYTALTITELGWKWIDAHRSQFVLTRPEKEENEDDIPF